MHFIVCAIFSIDVSDHNTAYTIRIIKILVKMLRNILLKRKAIRNKWILATVQVNEKFYRICFLNKTNVENERFPDEKHTEFSN